MTSPVSPLSPIINIDPGQTYAATPTIPAKYQTAITEIKNRQTETGSIISEHINVKKKRIYYDKDVGNSRISIIRRYRTVGTTWP